MAKANYNSEFLTYFKNPKTYEELDLVESGALKLHWANWNKLVNHLHSSIDRGEDITPVNEVNLMLDQYKEVELWIINKQGSIRSNLYELYTYYLDPRLRELWFELNEETLISFKSSSGPFIRLQSMRWFNFDIYKLFVYQKLLSKSGVIPRSFRLSVKIPMRCEFIDSVLDAIDTTIVQVSKAGMLMKVHSKADLQSLKLCNNVRFFGNLEPFIRSMGKKIEATNDIFNGDVFEGHNKMNQSFKLKSNILSIGNNSQNIFYSNGQEFFLFFSYDDLADLDKSALKGPMIEAVEKYEEFSLKQLVKVA
ncbi:hypothetical protein [Bacteriovorax sp. Seq25_V]|uniref:hypothetical protein n=1 Tax=Bacteriovorax sp. Seq25_V TaxID=1201288 RepID=UPI00038A04E9|nr:hypothetical protein [Bacteriovorax sp. Seq25_V]EQC45626.1 hypothetical protein M900_1877 [Bacteriovorax sp. Seq25_V]